LNFEDLINARYGHNLHFWDLRRRRNIQTLNLGEENQMALELRPAHDPTKSYGFAHAVISLKDLSSSIWTWYRKNGEWAVKKVIDIPAQPADPDKLPPPLKDFKAVPPLVTDIDLSLDDRFLYVSCWGTGELHQFDVSDPFKPKLSGKVQIGGIVRRKEHPKSRGSLLGGPQMVEISRDGRRVYFTNSLYSTIDDQFYPDGLSGWMVKLNVESGGGIAMDPNFFVDFGETRSHQIRLEGGDASTDSFCSRFYHSRRINAGRRFAYSIHARHNGLYCLGCLPQAGISGFTEELDKFRFDLGCCPTHGGRDFSLSGICVTA
jgi:selenium-binding protein 1